MGFNTTVVVLNDALNNIRDDPNFGERLASAIMTAFGGQKPVDVPAVTPGGGVFCNAATVIESHHADGYRAILVGGNCGLVVEGVAVGYHDTDEDRSLELLKMLAHKHGYALHKVPPLRKKAK